MLPLGGAIDVQRAGAGREGHADQPLIHVERVGRCAGSDQDHGGDAAGVRRENLEGGTEIDGARRQPGNRRPGGAAIRRR